MKTLRKKALRDIKLNLSSFVTIFLMTFLGVFVFSGIHAYMDGMNYSGKKFYDENNLQDIWVIGEYFSDDDFESLKNIDGVNDVERALVIKCDLEEYKDVVIETNFIESNNISKMYVVEGEGFDPNKDGMWFDSYLADYLGIKVGDELTLNYSGIKVKAKVLGLVNTPDHVYFIKDESAIFPTHDDYGFAYISANMLPEEVSFFTNMYVKADENADLDAVKAMIQAKIKNATAVVDREANSSFKAYQSEVEEGQTYSVIFTMLFLFIAILSVVSTMHRFVKKQRTQIGTLKALGVTRKQIQKHYVGFGLYISIVASALGLIVGRLVLGSLFLNMEQEYFEVPRMKEVTIPAVYAVAIAVVVIITFVTYLTCRKVLKEPASEALRLEVPKVKVGSVKASSKFGRKLSVGARWNIRDIKRNPGRTFTAIAGIVGCTMLIVCALGMKNTMTTFIDWQFDELYSFDYKLEIERGIDEAGIADLLETYGNETTMAVAAEALSKSGKKTTQQINIDDAPSFLHYSDHKRNEKTLSDDGVYLSEKLIKTLGYKTGDEIAWSIYGDETVYVTKIAGTVRQPQSQDIYMTRAFAESIGIRYIPDSIYTDMNLKGVKAIENVELITDKATLKDGMLNMINMMNTVIILLIVVSVILAFVIIYNLGTLSFSEKQYQFATMKVLGFRSKAIKKIYIMQNTWISAFSIVLGLPLGYAMTYVVFTSALGENYDMPVTVSAFAYAISAVGTFVVSYVINKILSGMIKKIDMVSSLKANE